MRVGFIGVGRMGAPMAVNVRAAGHEVTAYDPYRPSLTALERQGISTADSPAEVAQRSDVTVSMVLNADNMEQAVWGKRGFAEGAHPGSVLVSMSSLPPQTVMDFAERANGFALLDAPVSGGVEGATAGTLTILASGDPAAIATARPVFEAIGSQVLVVGERAGYGSITKTANQGMYMASLLAAGEMLAAAVKAGLDPDVVVDAISRSGGDSWALRNRLPLSWRNDYHSGGSLAVAAKDIRAAAELTRQQGIEAPVIALAERIVAATAEEYDEGDDLLVVKRIEDAGGVRFH